MVRKSSIPEKVAVFDIDGTLFRSSLIIELLEELIDEGVMPRRARKIFEKEYVLWLDRRGSYEDYIMKVVEAYMRNIKGVRLDATMNVARHLMLFHKNRVYRFTRDLIKKLQKTHYLLAISHSPYHVVEPFCREWGFRKVYAKFYETDKLGYFTGDIIEEDLIMDKGKILTRAMEKEHLTLTGSVGVGDSETDIPFLEMVSRPIAFNPNMGLYRAAKRRKWPIVVERKDVIYKF